MKQRYLSLDVLRGITVTFMCIVNNPGSWGKVFAPLRHAPWVGCTPTDLVYPFFIFCAGCAMAFSFSKYDGFSKEAVMKVIRRGIGIFLVGLLINLYPFFPLEPHDATASFWQNYGYWLANKRILGVLQRIGLSYLIAGLLALWLRKPARIMAAIGVLMAVFTGILVLFGTDPGPFTLEGTISRKIDVALLGENHVYHGYRFADGTRAAFDPEGFLGSLTGACSCDRIDDPALLAPARRRSVRSEGCPFVDGEPDLRLWLHQPGRSHGHEHLDSHLQTPVVCFLCIVRRWLGHAGPGLPGLLHRPVRDSQTLCRLRSHGLQRLAGLCSFGCDCQELFFL